MSDLIKQMYLNDPASKVSADTVEANWFISLFEDGESAINEAGVQFIERLNLFRNDFASGGFLSSLYEPPKELKRWRQGLLEDLMKFEQSLAGQIFEIMPVLRILDIKLKYDMYDFILNVYCKALNSVDSGISSEDILALACDEAERWLTTLSGEYSAYNSDFFTEMDWYLTSLSEMTQNSALQMRFLKAGGNFVDWGARLVRELSA
jgi:hypothetical protein